MSTPILLRAVYFHESVATLAQLSPTLCDQLRQQLPPAAFEAADAVTWVPVEWSNMLDALVLQELGEDALRELYRKATAISGSAPFYAPLWLAAIRLMGKGPWALMRWIPAAWRMTTRNFGTAAFHGNERGGRLLIMNLPEEIRTFPGFVPCVSGTLLGLIDMFSYDAHITAVREGDAIVFDVRWWPLPKTAIREAS